MFRTGIKSSEFWVILAVVLGALQSVLVAGSPVERLVGLGVGALAALGYTGSRVRVKTAEAAASVALDASRQAGESQVGGTE